VLLVLDGVEPLQHGLGAQQGELKDLGLRALLRRFAAMPPAGAHGLVVLTSRLAVKDIARWKDSAAAVLDVEKLSDEAGAALLRDNGVWGTDTELRTAARAFGGHPLALSLLASFLKETQHGDVRRRDHIRELLDDPENPRHDQARRVMESYEKEWFVNQPMALAVMHLIGLFDRPASGDCLAALRREPVIQGLTEAIIDRDEIQWQRAIARLREVRLLAELKDQAALDTLDAHPLVREWFGHRLEEANPEAWRAAHGRLYEHLRDTTREGKTPTLEDLAPLYQAIPHGCRAGRHQEALDAVYADRICRPQADGMREDLSTKKPTKQLQFFSIEKLGAVGSDLSAISWFFEKPYEAPVATLTAADQAFVLRDSAYCLRAQGRYDEALWAGRAALRIAEESKNWYYAAISALYVSDAELLAGNVAGAIATAEKYVHYADRTTKKAKSKSLSSRSLRSRTTLADALYAAGRRKRAERLFKFVEERRKDPLPFSGQICRYLDLPQMKDALVDLRDRARQALKSPKSNNSLFGIATDMLILGRPSRPGA
jgi:hypothetical protein